MKREQGGRGSVVRERWREERRTEGEKGMRRKRSQGAVEGGAMDREGKEQGKRRKRSQGAVEGGAMDRNGAR